MENLKHGSRKPNVKVNGLVNVYGMKFHNIEGGFGEGKKAMLAKEIANIHVRELKVINQSINMNRNRFLNGIDIVDLKGSGFEVNLIDHGIYTQNAINRSDNIYLLSERGYSKLLKILEDDFAWEQYDKLVDGYFNMREQVNSGQAKPLTTEEMLELQFKYAKEVKAEVIELKEDLNSFKEDLPLIGDEPDELVAIVKSKGTQVLGGKDSLAYKDKSLSRKIYSNIWKYVKEQFNVKKYKAIKRKYLEKAKEIVQAYEPPFYLKEEIIRINNQINFEEVI
ncbi:MAG: ORF6C domain-containing protein [Clostridium celatum]|uniref:ORF6C domain-containing protein n=1 Tax=Clostridium TaxID=1485 RepID=UPI0028FE8781|nr:ORF6C domain-containing protein [Clostridium celatum]MDU2121407.1 ORF6C domain-containing protein [Clostridium celatum]MDU4977954.1 ORF6C domain-containing protein [Clostridium celatum]